MVIKARPPIRALKANKKMRRRVLYLPVRVLVPIWVHVCVPVAVEFRVYIEEWPVPVLDVYAPILAALLNRATWRAFDPLRFARCKSVRLAAFG